MVKVLIDTSIIIEEIRRGSKIWEELKERTRKGEIELIASVVVLTELWSGRSMSDSKKVVAIEKLIEIIEFLEVGTEVAKLTGELVRKYDISGFDAIIAATCLRYKAQLLTLNIKDFKKIKGLKLYK